VQMIIFELKDRSKTADGLSERQQMILNGLMKEFSKK